MTNATYPRILFVVLVLMLAGCDGDRRSQLSAPSPVQPSPPQPIPTGIQLAGTVSDAAWRPLAGAKVEVVNGRQAGLSTTTDGGGNFRLTGAFDDTTQFRATKDGHVAAARPLPPSCAPCNPQWWIHFFLETLAPHADITGDYILTFIADSACSALPEDARTRTYTATVAPASLSVGPANSWFDVTLTGSTVVARNNSFMLGVAGDYAAADLGDLHGSAGLVEQIAPNTYLTLSGSIRTSLIDGSTISASLDGAVDRCELTTEWGSRYNCSVGGPVAHVQCNSQNHQLILKRR